MSKNAPAVSSISSNVGKVLFPLRVFLGITFVYAGLLKLISADYLNKQSPNGVLMQMQQSSKHSPIAFILNHAIEHSTLAGISIAIGELFVGLGLLVGLWARFAALGGFVLSLSFLLTVSWGTYPYFFGPDIVFMADFLPFIVAGDGGYLSLEHKIRDMVSKDLGVEAGTKLSNKPLEQHIQRRTFIQSGAAAGGLGVLGIFTGVVGRKMNHSTATVMPTTSPTPTGGTPTTPTAGTKVAKVVDVPVGTALQFNDPASGAPAYILQPKAGTFLAYTAICTHQGCIVSFDGSGSFSCPCHGAMFDATTGNVTRGPAQSPLTKLNVQAHGSDIYIV